MRLTIKTLEGKTFDVEVQESFSVRHSAFVRV
jgi:hypothetical protein